VNIGIIGTAGRKDDGPRMSFDLYVLMVQETHRVVKERCPPVEERRLRSGGAAWADHVAVTLRLLERAPYLELHLPAPFKDGRFVEGNTRFNAGRTSNYYHDLFSKKMNVPTRHSLKGIQELIDGEKVVIKTYNGFHARNLIVGDVDLLIAMTWGEGDIPKDGGTKHTWDHSSAETKIHIPLASL